MASSSIREAICELFSSTAVTVPLASRGPMQGRGGRKRRAARTLAAVCLAAAAPALAQEADLEAAPLRNWQGANGANWNVPANWSGTTVPNSAADATVNNGGGPVVTDAQAVRILRVGDTATGALTISGGGVVTNFSSAFLANGTGSNGTVTITGAGSAWNANTGFALQVGAQGTGVLNIVNGGSLTNLSTGLVVLGASAGSSGAMTVNAGSANIANFQIGSGGQGTLAILNAGTVTSGVTSIGLGSAATPLATATVTGPGSRWTTSTLTIGNRSDGRLDITAGGSVTTSGAAFIANTDARQASSGSGLVNVDAASWNVSGNLAVGGVKDGTLNIVNGSTVTVNDRLVSGSGAGVGRVVVDHATLNVGPSDTVEVGGGAGSGTGAGFMTLRNGATGNFNIGVLNIAGRANSVPGSLLVEGAGTTLNVSGTVSISNNVPGTLVVRDGAVMNSNALGAGGGSGNASMLIDNATWNINGFARLARNAGTANMLIQNGGAVNATGEMELGLNGTAGVTIAGTGGTLNAAAVIGGGRDANGNLVPANGNATLTFAHTNAGLAFAPPVRGFITVNQSGTGTTIMNGDSDHTGFVNVTGGIMRAGIVNAFSENAAYTVAGGTLELNNLDNEVGSLEGTTNVVLGAGTLTTGRLNTSTSYSGVISGTGGLAKTGTGVFRIDAPQAYTGATTILNGTLQAGVANVIAPTSGLTVAQSGTFFQAGFNQTLNNLNNAGTVIVGGAPPGATLTVLGSYVGSGGTVVLNTVLASDNSPADRMVINGGTATGTSLLRIVNLGGLGSQTTGNGIQVVNATGGGTTAPGAFTLAAPVVAGPFEYKLLRGSRDASNPQAWYLRTADIPRVETSLYAALPALGILYGGKLLDTLDERWGSWKREADAGLRGAGGSGYRVASADGVPGSSSLGLKEAPDGVWGRFVVQRGRREGAADGVAGVGPSYDFNFYALQGGGDVYQRETADRHRDHAGLYGAFGHSSGEVTHLDGTPAGSNSFEALTFGGYWTHFGPENWYVDGILQTTFYDATGSSNRGLPILKSHGFGYAASVEGGYPFRLKTGWSLEPQAQLVYGKLDLKSTQDAGGSVSFQNTDTVVGRVGARLAHSWNSGTGAQPRLTTVWGRLSEWHEFKGQPTAVFSAANGLFPFVARLAGNWWELKTGFTTQVTKVTSFYASVGYQRGNDGDRYAYDGKIGVRMEW